MTRLLLILLMIAIWEGCHNQHAKDIPIYLQNIGDSLSPDFKHARMLRKESQLEGLHAYMDVLEKSKRAGDNAAILEAYRRSIFISGVFVYKTDTAVTLAREAIDFGYLHDDANTLCEMYGLLGVSYQAAGILDSAISAYLQALKYMELDPAPDSLKNYPMYLNIADLYSQLGNQPLAINYTLKYRDEYVLNIKDTSRLISIYNNLSHYYNLSGDPDSSYLTIQKAYNLQNQCSQCDGPDNTLLVSLAAVYNNEQKYDSAYYFAQRSYDMALEEDNLYFMVRSLVLKLEIAQRTGNASLFKEELKNPLFNDLSKIAEIPTTDRERLHHALYLGYDMIGNKSLAYQHLQKTHALMLENHKQEMNRELEKYEIDSKKEKHEKELLGKQLQLRNQQNVILLLSLLTLVAISLAGGIYWWQRKKKLLHDKQIELLQMENTWAAEKALLQGQLEERNRISRELHDDLGATLTSIVMTGELIKKKNPNAHKEIASITTIANNMADNLNEIVWSLNSRNDSLKGLVAYTRKFAVRFLEQAEIRLNFIADIPEYDVTVPSKVRRALFLCAKECINNAVKYSGATHMDVHFIYKDQLLTLLMKDNGKGLAINPEISDGNGLKNIKKNMELIHGNVLMASQDGFSITLTCEIPSSL